MPQATVPIVGPNVVRFPSDVGSDTRATSVTPWATDSDDAPAGFTLLEVVGTGGMGVVRRARDLSLGRDVAVKLLNARHAGDPAVAARFFGEARITGQLQHPGIPAVYQAGSTPRGQPFLAMKLIRGDTLEKLLRTGSPVNALAVFEAVCQAVGYAHARGVIHRDLKPANVMVDAFGELAISFKAVGRVAEAVAIQERSTKARVASLGPDHPETLNALGNLANYYNSAGRKDNALALQERVTATRDRVLGADHPNTLGSRAGLALLPAAGGRPNTAGDSP